MAECIVIGIDDKNTAENNRSVGGEYGIQGSQSDNR